MNKLCGVTAAGLIFFIDSFAILIFFMFFCKNFNIKNWHSTEHSHSITDNSNSFFGSFFLYFYRKTFTRTSFNYNDTTDIPLSLTNMGLSIVEIKL